MTSDSDVEDLLLPFALSRSCRKRIWVHDINKNRKVYAEYHRLCRELLSYEDRFLKYFHMYDLFLHQFLSIALS
jgi:hypothetical protein